ncbi:hypothetical protein SAMN05518672_10271 [Chitinophaga sp. CF118]|uniref:DUF779 domain-containing protein n=1 Tax=Chitinophaga sp. CF118 TaxID=1884367 RepID=UPI0008F197D9|nr:DUF779 domain-containing protein [Chitinophaga sp. CF118]SFD46935.1 hypothetical protein SAMN05518672_10271 [Chitinophaga sp. CF118]
MPERIIATTAAIELIGKLQQQHGNLMFHQSGGCCDGSQPMCFTEGEFRTGQSDVCLGEVGGCKFYMGRDQFEYWKHTQLILDVIPGRGSSFSLEIPLGVRFHTRSRVFSDEELTILPEIYTIDSDK